MTFVFSLFVMLSKSIYADEIIINGNRVIIKTKGGEIIDTANPPKGQEVKNGENVEISEGCISIGNITGNRGKYNIRRTNLNNVTIINNNEKTTIYRKGIKNQNQAKDDIIEAKEGSSIRLGGGPGSTINGQKKMPTIHTIRDTSKIHGNVSTGEITNNDDEQENSIRSTNSDNVTIINNN